VFIAPTWRDVADSHFHVNGENPEAVAQVVRLALEFGKNSKGRGHRHVRLPPAWTQRSDEPSFTQPLLYRTIEKRQSVREGYLDICWALPMR